MRGRFRVALFSAFLALLLLPGNGYSNRLGASSASPAKNQQLGSALRQPTQPGSEQIHVVRQGDSLSKISRIFHTTPEALKSANGLKGSKIIIGQKLRIPVPQNDAAEINPPKETAASALTSAPNVSLSTDTEPDSSGNDDFSLESRRMRLIKAGFELINVRYRFGGGSEQSGFDCSGLVKNLFSKFNIELPHSSREQFKQGEKVDRDKLEAGDLVFFSSGGSLPTHVGIYIGNDKFLHAARKARKVIVSDLNKFWYTMRYLGARRIMDLWWEEPGSTAEDN
jgi:cell wall-associated NlpC family hydrolase